MAQVPYIGPTKPIWPVRQDDRERHPTPEERRQQREQKKRRRDDRGGDDRDQDQNGHIDEYV